MSISDAIVAKVGSNGSIDKLILFDVTEITIDLCLNRLTLVCLLMYIM
jgi:hypothetical protein